MRLTPTRITLVTALAAPLAGGCDKLSNDPKLVATATTEIESKSGSETTGSAERGHGRFAHYGCTTCHHIPGVQGADGVIGPPLNRMALRGYVGGVVKNTPENLVRWIQNPPGVDPMTAMPNLRVSEQDARDMAAYLYTLR